MYPEELDSAKSSVTLQRTDRHGILGQKPTDLQVSLWASIMGSATLCFSRWAQRRGRQLHRVQNRRKHRARLLTEKALRCRCPVRPGEEKVVHGSEAFPLTRQIESSKLMATQRQVAVSPLHIGTRALEHDGEPLGLVMEVVLSLRATPFNIGIAGRAARTLPIDGCFCL